MIYDEQRPGGGHRGAARDRGRSAGECNQSVQLSLSFDDLLDEERDEVLVGRDQAERDMDHWWTSTALQAIRAMAATGAEFQAYDLVECPEPDHPNRWGALLTRAARDGLIVPVGAAPSRRPTAARSLTRTWRGGRR